MTVVAIVGAVMMFLSCVSQVSAATPGAPWDYDTWALTGTIHFNYDVPVNFQPYPDGETSVSTSTIVTIPINWTPWPDGINEDAYCFFQVGSDGLQHGRSDVYENEIREGSPTEDSAFEGNIPSGTMTFWYGSTTGSPASLTYRYLLSREFQGHVRGTHGLAE